MFKKNNLIKLKELQRSKLLQLEQGLNYNKIIITDEFYLKSLLVSFNDNDQRKELDSSMNYELERINTLMEEKNNSLTSEDIEDIYDIVSNYRYDDINNNIVINELLDNIDNITKKMFVNDKYNINNTIFFWSPKYEHKYVMYNSNINKDQINRTIEQYFDAWKLYRNKYYHQNTTLEFNDVVTNVRNFKIYFDARTINRIFGLPHFSEYYNVPLFKDLDKITENMPFDVDGKFFVLARDYREELLEHEENSEVKFNWVRMHERAMAFKNLGNFIYNDVCVYMKDGFNNYFLKTRAANKNINGFIELELTRFKNSREDTLSPINVRFKGERQYLHNPITYLGLASTYHSASMKSIYDNLNNPESLEFNFDNYLALNQERMFNSGELIICDSNAFDNIILSKLDLDYLFVSSDYNDDERLVADDETEEYIENIYNAVNEPISIAQFKTIFNLAKKIKRNELQNEEMYNNIKNTLYESAERIIKSPIKTKHKRKTIV